MYVHLPYWKRCKTWSSACCQRTPSLGEKIQYCCLICLDSEQPSCFGCLIILGHNFKKSWATAQNLWSGYEESAEFQHIWQFWGVWTWDMKHFSDQAAKEYVGFWDVKSVFKQAAYYMEWMGPRRWQHSMKLAKQLIIQAWHNWCHGEIA